MIIKEEMKQLRINKTGILASHMPAIVGSITQVSGYLLVAGGYRPNPRGWLIGVAGGPLAYFTSRLSASRLNR